MLSKVKDFDGGLEPASADLHNADVSSGGREEALAGVAEPGDGVRPFGLAQPRGKDPDKRLPPQIGRAHV